MKTIEVDDELYQYIASHTRHIGESASDILRRMLKISAASQPAALSKDVVSAERYGCKCKTRRDTGER
jgi:negative modulator of initiation of replication